MANLTLEGLHSPELWPKRYHNWYDIFCSLAPRTCELVKSRPEIMDCPFMNVNYVKLHAGAHLKPHFGNGSSAPLVNSLPTILTWASQTSIRACESLQDRATWHLTLARARKTRWEPAPEQRKCPHFGN